MMRKILFWGLIVISLAVFGYQQTSFVHAIDHTARTYYVSQSSGNDTNTGLSPQTAWKTAAKVNSSSFQPGDQILFKRGDAWRELLKISWSGSPGNPIVIGSYSSGDLPKFITSAAWNEPSAWMNRGGNIWESNYNGKGTTGNEMFSNTWGLYANQSAGAAANLNQNAGALNVQVVTTGKTRSDIQLYSQGGFTIQKGKYYQLQFSAKSSVPFTNDIDAAHVGFIQNGPPFTYYDDAHNYGSEGTFVGTEWKEYRYFFHADRDTGDARISLSFGNALPSGASLFVDNVSLKPYTPNEQFFPIVDVGNINFDHGAAYGRKKIKASDLQTAGDFYYDTGTASVLLYSQVNPAHTHQSIEFGLYYTTIRLAPNVHDIAIKQLHLENSAYISIAADSGTSNITVSDNELTNIGGGLRLEKTGPEQILSKWRLGNAIQFWNDAHDIVVERNKIWEIYDTALTTQGDTGTVFNIYFRNNVVWDAQMWVEEWIRAGTIHHLYIDNNTFVNQGKQSSRHNRPHMTNNSGLDFTSAPTVHNIFIRNNIFSEVTDSFLRLPTQWVNAANLEIKNNLFWTTQPTGAAINWGNWAGYKKDYDFDHLICGQLECWQTFAAQNAIDNIVADPQFVDPAKHNYNLKASSPAINRNIGAYAYTTQSSNPADLTDEGDTPGDEVNIFDYNVLIAGFGTTYDIFDYNTLVGRFGE